jgi:hypothetical protein
MKINWKSIFGTKSQSTNKSAEKKDEIDYDKHVQFYYTNLINSIILFSLTTEDLEKLAGPVFNPMFELGSEIDYAFTPVCLETIFRKGRIDSSFREELLTFKKETDDIPKEIWDWEFIDNSVTWISIRQKANTLLDKLHVTSRIYNDDFTTIYDSEGKILTRVEK